MPITPQEALQRCIEHRELFHDEMTAMMRLIMSGEMSPELVAGLLVALRTKKETVGEIAAAAKAWGQNDDITVVTVRRTG